jgi:DNA polymerase I-like protein with 3'-5' exonuclease and polymerase domains
MSQSAPWKYEWITAPAELQSIIETLKSEEFVSVDTETAGWQTGNEYLCLVQIGAPSTKKVYLIDALAIKDLAPLAAILETPHPLIIAHNAGFEERQFARSNIKMAGVIDTLTLARRLRPDLPSHSLQACCRFILNIGISKQEQKSDWSRRPLTTSQVEYAALDAEVTAKLYQALREMDRTTVIDPNYSVAQLMQELTNTVNERLTVLGPMAARVALLHAREESIRRAMQTRLLAGELPYEGPLGEARISHIKSLEVDPAKVREQFPSLAPVVIEEYVDKSKLQALLQEQGLGKEAMREVYTEHGSSPRLSIVLKRVLEQT